MSAIKDSQEVKVTIAVQVNGKLRGTVEVDSIECMLESRVVELAMADEKVKKWAEGEIKKIIFIPGKLVNLVG